MPVKNIVRTVLWFIFGGFLVLFAGLGACAEAENWTGKGQKYALLIGGGLNRQDCYESLYMNIEYAARALKRLGYEDDSIKILFYGGKTPEYPIVEGKATKKSVLEELSRLEKRLLPDDSLLIFRSGHGIIKLVFEKYGILGLNESLPKNETVNVTGTAAVMLFPDGCLSCTEFEARLARIRAKQIVVILNQCFSGAFADISDRLDNTVVISETGEVGVAFVRKTSGKKLSHKVWPFVRCLFDGFLENHPRGIKRSVSEAFAFMVQCNPNIKGLPINLVQGDNPLLKEKPRIKYGCRLKRGSVYIQ